VFFSARAAQGTFAELWAIDTEPGVVSVGDVVLMEGDSVTTATFPVTLSAPSTTPVSVAYVTVSASAQPGSDFVPRSGTLTFAPGTTALTVPVDVVGDLRDEADESFTLELAPVRGSSIADGRGVAIIVDDDASSARLGPSQSVAEGDGGVSQTQVAVTLTTRDGQPTVVPTTVGFATENGTALFFSDYQEASGTVTFPAGTPSGATSPIAIGILGDVLDETDEFFAVRLNQSGSAAVDETPARITILDDDGAGSTPIVELSHGSCLRSTLAPPPGGVDERDFYVTRQDRYASYEAVIDEAGGAALPIQLERLDSTGVWVEQIARTVGTGGSVSLSWTVDPFLVFVPAIQRLRVRSAGCTSACGPNDTYRIRFYDTTLSAARFNNTGTQRTSLILQNASADTVSGRVYLWGSSGSLLPGPTFDIAPWGTFEADTAASYPGISGSLTVAHDGRYGALTGKAVTLDPATGATFEAPLTAKPR
jgi:hypothetical protein